MHQRCISFHFIIFKYAFEMMPFPVLQYNSHPLNPWTRVERNFNPCACPARQCLLFIPNSFSRSAANWHGIKHSAKWVGTHNKEKYSFSNSWTCWQQKTNRPEAVKRAACDLMLILDQRKNKTKRKHLNNGQGQKNVTQTCCNVRRPALADENERAGEWEEALEEEEKKLSPFLSHSPKPR